jgi:hypothetical protein
VSRIAMAVAAAVFFGTVSGCTALPPVQNTAPTGAQRLECERNGGYWATAAGFCRIGA